MDNNISYDLNSKLSVATIVTMCSIPFVIIIMVPVLVSGIVESLQVSAQQAGFVASTDMAGYTLGTLLTFFLINRCNWRFMCGCALILMILANGLSAVSTDYSLLLMSRLFSGLGSGVVTAILLAAIGQMRDADSAYAWWLVAQSIISGVLFYLLPEITLAYGVGGIFSLFCLLCAIALCFLNVVPKHSSHKKNTENTGSSKQIYLLASFGILALFLFECGLMAPYTYTELLGRAGGLTLSETSLSLSISMLGGIAGGVMAAKISTKYGRLTPIVVGNLLIIISLLLLRSENQSFITYAIAVSILFGVWNCVLPFLLGALSEADSSGKVLALSNGAIGMALVAGPFIAALIIGNNNDSLRAESYFPVLALGIVLLILSTISFFCMSNKLKQRYSLKYI